MPPRTRSPNDVEVDVEQLRALEARRTKHDANEPPFLYRPGMPQDPRSLAALQRSAGNAAVATLIRSRPAARPLPVQRFNPGGAKPAPQFPGMGKSPAEQLGGGGAGGGAGPALGAGEESVFIGGSGPKPKAGKVLDDGKAGQSSMAAAAGTEKAAILADAAASNAAVDKELAGAQKQLTGRIKGARTAAQAAVTGVVVSTNVFVTARYLELNQAVDGAEKAAIAQATAATMLAANGALAANVAMQDAVRTIGNGIQTRIGGVADQIANAISGVSLPDLPGVGAIRSGIASLVRGAASGVKTGIGVVQQLIQRGLSAGMAAVANALGKARNMIVNVVQKAAGAIRAAAAKAAAAIMTVAGLVGRVMSAFLRGVVFPALEKLRKTMSGHLVNGAKKAKLAIKTNVEYHLKALEKFAKTAVPGGGKSAGGAAGGGEDPSATFKAIGDQSRKNNKLVVNLVSGRFGSVIAGVAAMAMGAAAQVAAKVRGVATQIISTVSEKVQGALGVARQIGAAVTSMVQTIIGSLRSAFDATVGWVRRAAAHPVDELANFGSTALGKARSFISSAVSNVLRGNFSLPSLGVSAFTPGAANQGPVPTEAVTASMGTSSMSVLQIVGIVVAALAALVLLPVILATLVGAALVVAAALVIFGPLAAVLALVIYGAYKLIKWIATPSPLTLEHTTSLQAPDGSPKTRVTVGVGERVTIKANKMSTFKASEGDPTSTSPKGGFTWRAPFAPGAADITADSTDKSQSAKVSFTVVAPSSVTAKKEKEKDYPAGTQGAGMILNFVYGPGNVSFGGGEARERSGPASGVSGYYEHEGQPHFHTASPGFFTIAENNQLAGDTRDSASQFGQPPPWSKGSFHWMIPNEFRADDSVAAKVFTDVKQEFTIDDTGTTTITKAGASVTRKP